MVNRIFTYVFIAVLTISFIVVNLSFTAEANDYYFGGNANYVNDLWLPGMQWDFFVESTSAGKIEYDNMTMTVLLKETIQDNAGVAHDSYKVIREWENDPDTFSYIWYETENLDKITGYTDFGHAHSTTSYAWIYSSTPKPFTIGKEIDLEFNATITVSVSGHPLIKRASSNIYKVEGIESISLPFGTFDCYNITITDKDDGIISWNYYYSQELHHWVKMIDRMPDSMVDKVEYSLMNISSKPVITTEPGEVNERDIIIKWAQYPQASSYVLYENDVMVYNGTSLQYSSLNKDNGVYEYVLKAWLGTELKGSDDPFKIIVNWLVSPPTFFTDNQTTTKDSFDITWNAVEEADRYVLYENDNEIYNGSDLSFTITDKTNGVYRYRVQTINLTAEASELSTSILITVDVDESNPNLMFLGIGIIVLIIVISSILNFMNKSGKLKLGRTQGKKGNEINKDEKSKGGKQ
jgi:hypothetical protein